MQESCQLLNDDNFCRLSMTFIVSGISRERGKEGIFKTMERWMMERFLFYGSLHKCRKPLEKANFGGNSSGAIHRDSA
jgi:hypothetical protein